MPAPRVQSKSPMPWFALLWSVQPVVVFFSHAGPHFRCIALLGAPLYSPPPEHSLTAHATSQQSHSCQSTAAVCFPVSAWLDCEHCAGSLFHGFSEIHGPSGCTAHTQSPCVESIHPWACEHTAPPCSTAHSYQAALDQTEEGAPEGTPATRTQAPRTRCFLAHASVVSSLSQ